MSVFVVALVVGLPPLGLHHFVDQAIFLGFVGGHVVVAVGVFFYLLDRFPRVFGENFVEILFGAENVLCADRNVGSLSLGAAHHLVDHHFGVWKGEALAFGAGGEEHGCCACRHADADGRNIRLDVIHRVVDRHCRGNRSAGGVDVELDVFLRVFGFEEEELGDNDVRGVVVDRAAQKDNAFAEKARVNIVRAFAEGGFFDDGGDEVGHDLCG